MIFDRGVYRLWRWGASCVCRNHVVPDGGGLIACSVADMCAWLPVWLPKRQESPLPGVRNGADRDRSQRPGSGEAVPGVAPHEDAVANGDSPHPVCGEHLVYNAKTGKVQ